MVTKYSTVRRQIGAGLILSAIALSLSFNFAIAGDANKMDGKVIELVTFKLAAGVSEEAFTKHMDVVQTFISRQKGFVSRRLSKAADGTYLDHVTWDSMADAKAAMDASMKEASLLPFMQSIDPASMKLDHQPVVASIN
jgi:hypothetical protein